MDWEGATGPELDIRQTSRITSTLTISMTSGTKRKTTISVVHDQTSHSASKPGLNAHLSSARLYAQR